MTREEAKHIVDVAFGVPQAVRRTGEDRTYHEDEIREAKNMAIKALEQELILDKIRAEIVELWKNEPCAIDGGCLDEMLQIIDKYKVEKNWINLAEDLIPIIKEAESEVSG